MPTILDMECAECGRLIPQDKDDEKLITKSLGVLQDDGLYAFYLYLKAEDKKNIIQTKTLNFLRQDKIMKGIIGDETDPLKAMREKFTSLEDILFAKELLERVLVYARYHAKALKEQ